MEERQPKRAKFAEASSSSTSVIGNNYYVFLSFRGLDTRNGFVDHLYHKLVDVGLPFHPNFVFRDDEKLPFGEDVATNLISAIEQSKVSIPVISENYATSEWCLRELIHIMKCQKKGQKVLTVFYKVKPSEVREVRTSEGAFGNAFRSSMHLFKDDVKEEGPEALREAAASRIFESDKFASGHEGELVKELVRVIMDEQQHDFLPPLPGNLVGIDDRVAQVMKLADTNPSETRIIGICGIGGIGKTTLATNIYNKLSKKFECRSFLRDIRETINLKGMEHIQSLLISDITKNPPNGVCDSVRGIRGIQLGCENKKVLIFLDDVGHRDHIDKLIGGCKFKPGSRIIITCRDKALLKSEYERYEVKEMNHENSLLLLSRYAFEGEQPPTEFANLSSDIVATTGGLPLALEIIGSLLKGKPENIWIDTLEKLKKVPNKDVQEKLKISYDSLEYKEQQMFLDIACFFIGIHKRITTYLWKDLQLHPDSGLARMIELSLIKYDYNNELRMHDQLRDLGRAIACPTNKKPWKCSRLWGEEAITVQRSKEENRHIEALHLDENGSNMFMKRESFKRMPYLKFLRLSKVNFVGDFEDSLSELRWLEWEKCPDSFEAINVYLEKLLILDLSDGNISENWGGWRSIKMERLKVLNLSRCAKLSSLPSTISELGELEELDASKCESLGGEVPIDGLSSLQILLLGKKSDVVLDFVNYTYHERPSSKVFNDLSSRQHLDLTNCDLPVSLTVLELTCQNRTLPELSRLIHLEELILQFCEYLESIPVLPSGIVLFWVFWCDKLKALPNLSSLEHLSELRIVGCSELEEIEGLEGLKSLGQLSICGCMKLSNLKGLERLESLRELEMMELDAPLMNDGLSQVQSLGRFKNFDLLRIESCQSLIRPDISQLTHLQVLWFTECKNIVEIKGIERLKKLRSLDILGCNSITHLSLPNNLEELYIDDCPNLHDVQGQVKSVTWFEGGVQYREKSDELTEVQEASKF